MAGRQRAPGTRRSRPTPLKSLGQHFLRDESVLERIAAACELTPADTVIEVGPGTGALTRLLLASGAQVIAVEIDSRLCRLLHNRFGSEPRFSLVEADVLALEPREVLRLGGIEPATAYTMAGNLPYNAGAAILRHFLEAEQPPRRLIVMLQREVAQSICASPGSMSLLSLAVQVYAQPQALFDVAPGAFEPPPRVVSTLLRLDTREEPLVEAAERRAFFEVARAGFVTPRKQLRNGLATGLRLPPARAQELLGLAGIDPALRPGDLAIAQWLTLSRVVGLSHGA